MITFGQVKSSTVANVAGVNVNDPQFASYVNEAVSMLMNLGNWWGTVQTMTGQIYQGCVVWPHNVTTVLAMDICNQRVRLANYWYQFTPKISGKYAALYRKFGGYPCQESVVQFSGTTPLFDPPTASNPFALQFTCDNPADYGMTVTVYGVNAATGTEVFSNRPDGSSQRGLLVTLAAVVATTVVFSAVTAIVKDVTTGDVRAWQQVAGGNGTCVGIFGGSQTNAEFLFSQLSSVNPGLSYSMSALVKIGFEPVSQDADLLPIGNIEAIKMMIQAIRLRESVNIEGAVGFEKDAVRRLNMELRTRFPDQQTVIAMHAFGTAQPMRRVF